MRVVVVACVVGSLLTLSSCANDKDDVSTIEGSCEVLFPADSPNPGPVENVLDFLDAATDELEMVGNVGYSPDEDAMSEIVQALKPVVYDGPPGISGPVTTLSDAVQAPGSEIRPGLQAVAEAVDEITYRCENG